jgi:hypothetical protein
MRENRSYDPRSRVLDLDWRLVRAQAPHLEPLATTRFRLRQHYPADVERLLARAGLRIASRHGDFDRSPLGRIPFGRGVSRALFAFLKAMRPQPSWRRARWFSSFFDQRIRMPRLRLSQE